MWHLTGCKFRQAGRLGVRQALGSNGGGGGGGGGFGGWGGACPPEAVEGVLLWADPWLSLRVFCGGLYLLIVSRQVALGAARFTQATSHIASEQLSEAHDSREIFWIFGSSSHTSTC